MVMTPWTMRRKTTPRCEMTPHTMQMGDDATDNATVDVDSDGVVTADCQIDVRTPQSRCQGFYPVLLDKILDNAIVRFVSSVQDSIWQSAPRLWLSLKLASLRRWKAGQMYKTLHETVIRFERKARS